MLVRLFLILLIAVPAAALANTQFVAVIEPRPNSGSTGSGSATIVLNDAETEVTFDISFQGLTSTELAAHVHRPDGTIAFELPLGSPKQASWLNPGLADVLSLRAELMFILIHTQQNPGGELRGEIVGALATDYKTWGAVKAVYASQP